MRKIGVWNRDPLTELTITCRTAVAVDKAFGESVRAAREAGRSWSEIAHALGLPSTLSNWEEIAAVLATRRQAVWSRTAGEAGR